MRRALSLVIESMTPGMIIAGMIGLCWKIDACSGYRAHSANPFRESCLSGRGKSFSSQCFMDVLATTGHSFLRCSNILSLIMAKPFQVIKSLVKWFVPALQNSPPRVGHFAIFRLANCLTCAFVWEIFVFAHVSRSNQRILRA